jgi:hypothetical protein
MKEVKRRKLSIEKIIIFVLYACVFGFVAYILASVYLPDLTKSLNYGEYEISLNNPTNSLRSFYFEKDILGGPFKVNGVDYYPVTSEEIVDINFKPKKIIDENAEGILEIAGINNGTEVYLNDKLVIPDFTKYDKVATFGDEEVWVRRGYSSGPGEYDNIDDYLYFNLPGASIYSFGELSQDVPELTDYEKTETLIDTIFRHELTLAIYSQGDLELEFTKQDFNINNGKDEYTVSITDSSGGVWFRKVYGDDGDQRSAGVLGPEDTYYINAKLSDKPDVYYIYFDRDDNNKWEDSSIRDIKVNSNKVLILGNILVNDGFKLYTEIYDREEIKFKTYWRGDLSVQVTGDAEKTVWIPNGEDTYLTLNPGSYNLWDKKWKSWISGYSAFSPSENSWFYLPSSNKDDFVGDVIIIDRNWIDVQGNLVNVKLDVNNLDEYSFQVLDRNLFSIEKIEMVI